VKSPFQRRYAIAALLLAPLLGACGFSAQTDQVYQAASGVNDRSGAVYILDAEIITESGGTGTFAGTLVNDRIAVQTLTSVSGKGITTVNGAYKIPDRGVLDMADPDPKTDGPQLVITGAGVQPGDYVTLTFSFASGQTTTMKVPIFTNTSDYASVPLPLPSDSSSPSGSSSPDSTSSATPGQ
jgi:hypothetical protein